MGHFNSPVIRKLTSPRIWLESSPQQKKAKGKHSKSIIPSIMERHIYVCHLACKWTTWIKQYICNYIQHLSRVYGPSWAIISVPPPPPQSLTKKKLVRGCLELPRSIFPTSKSYQGNKPSAPPAPPFFCRCGTYGCQLSRFHHIQGILYFHVILGAHGVWRIFRDFTLEDYLEDPMSPPETHQISGSISFLLLKSTNARPIKYLSC